MSRSPTTTVYGAFMSCAARIFFPTVSLVSSTWTRSPAARAVWRAPRNSDVAIGDGHEPDLLRREPQGERAAVVLDQHGAEPIEGAEDRAVDHHGPVTLVVVAGVLHVEALGHGEVALHGGELPQSPDRVAEMEVDLGPVEGALTLGDPVVQPALLEREGERLGGARRRGLVHDRLGHRQRGELHDGVGEAERPVDLERQVEHREDPVDQLVGRADDVRVVLRYTAEPEQAVEGARLLLCR